MDLLCMAVGMVGRLVSSKSLCILIYETLMWLSLAVVDNVSMVRRVLVRLEVLDEALWVRRACAGPLVVRSLGA